MSVAVAFTFPGGLALPAGAREVHLGGSKAPGQPLAPNIVELPTIVADIRREDGGWNHVRIDAWLAPRDAATARDMDDKRTSIVARSEVSLPGKRGFEALRSARDGNLIAKDIIHAAAEQVLGRPWTGDVLIRNILVY